MPAIDPRPSLSAPDDDPYLWLEEVDGQPALAWVEAQNRATLARFADRCFAMDRELLEAILTEPTICRWLPGAARGSSTSGRMRRIRAGCGARRRWRAFAPNIRNGRS